MVVVSSRYASLNSRRWPLVLNNGGVCGLLLVRATAKLKGLSFVTMRSDDGVLPVCGLDGKS